MLWNVSFCGLFLLVSSVLCEISYRNIPTGSTLHLPKRSRIPRQNLVTTPETEYELDLENFRNTLAMKSTLPSVTTTSPTFMERVLSNLNYLKELYQSNIEATDVQKRLSHGNKVKIGKKASVTTNEVIRSPQKPKSKKPKSKKKSEKNGGLLGDMTDKVKQLFQYFNFEDSEPAVSTTEIPGITIDRPSSTIKAELHFPSMEGTMKLLRPPQQVSESKPTKKTVNEVLINSPSKRKMPRVYLKKSGYESMPTFKDGRTTFEASENVRDRKTAFKRPIRVLFDYEKKHISQLVNKNGSGFPKKVANDRAMIMEDNTKPIYEEHNEI